MNKIFSVFAIMLLLASAFSLSVNAADTTAPYINMYVGQDENLLSHNLASNTLTIWAKFWNRDDESTVDSCQVDWGDGSGWQNVDKGTEDVRYMVSHTYSTPGEKTIKYRCTSVGGTNAGADQHIDWDSITILSTDSSVPFINMYLGQEMDLLSHNDYSYSLTVWAKFWNRDDESEVVSCEADWGDGSGWQSVDKGAENNRYMVSHTYSTYGTKIVSYRCTSIGGTNSGSTEHVDWDSIKLVKWEPGPGPEPEPSQPRQTVRIGNFELDNQDGELSAFVSIDNLFDSQLDNVRITAMVPELGIRSATRQFDMASGDTVSRRLILEVPENAPSGDYDVMLIVSNDEFRRVAFRQFTVGGAECDCITTD